MARFPFLPDVFRALDFLLSPHWVIYPSITRPFLSTGGPRCGYSAGVVFFRNSGNLRQSLEKGSGHRGVTKYPGKAPPEGILDVQVQR